MAVAAGRRQVLSDQDRDDERVDGNDTGHDDGDQTLEVVRRESIDTRGVWGELELGLPTFMIRSGRKVPTPAIPIPDLAVPYAAPMPRRKR